jgi:hypothetical protein
MATPEENIETTAVAAANILIRFIAGLLSDSTIRATRVSLPTRCARMMTPPRPGTVPPVTPLPVSTAVRANDISKPPSDD